jgi:hypothetical protein
VRKDDEVGALGQLAVRAGGLAAQLGGQRRRAARAGVRAQDGVTPAASARAMFPAPIKPTCMPAGESTTG